MVKRGRGARDAGVPDQDVEAAVAFVEGDREPAVRTGGSVLLKGATVLTATREAMPATDILVLKGKIEKIGKDNLIGARHPEQPREPTPRRPLRRDE